MARTKQTARISTGGKAPRGANGPPLKAKKSQGIDQVLSRYVKSEGIRRVPNY